jgi:tetratricopeptide (TPR) repeat protein
MPVKKKTAKKTLYRNVFVSAVALILIAGLVLSAVLGFADFLASGGEQIYPPAEEDYLSRLNLAIMAAFYQNDAVRAEKFFREALALDGKNAQAHLYFGIFLALRGRGAAARIHLEKVLALEPEGSALAELARAYMEGSGFDLPPSP